jgi:UDP-N-acetylmuramoyl-L-alanyl-D-glutamate--2,6-diaminopimelate ligase
MRLAELVAGLRMLSGVDAAAADAEITGLAYDSREVTRGTLFFCVPGEHSDGHSFAAQAIRAGASALIVERSLSLGVPEVVVPSTRAAMGPVAARFNGDPTSRLQVVGVTGTNGKTTTAFLVRALLQASARGSTARSDRATGGSDHSRAGGGEAARPSGGLEGVKTGLLGTVTSIIGGSERAVQRTTPEAVDLQALFREMLDAGDGACAMEVSSHALAMGRTAGIRFAAGVFTNLTQDHLDYHATMEDYYRAKRRLFLPDDGPAPGACVINIGNAWGRRLALELGDDTITFAVEDQAADYRATDVRCDAAGCRFALHVPAGGGLAGGREVALPMRGRFNVENALGALAAAHALGHDLGSLVAALERGVRVPGRFEPVDEGQDFSVLVDYAHTPDSLENVLRAARELAHADPQTSAASGPADEGPGEAAAARGSRRDGEHSRPAGAGGRVISVFGAGGDRDRGKRPQMGEISARLADLTIVTSDNPRSEQPQEIVAQIVAGVAPADAPSVQIEVDRRAAIDRAITLAERHDIVVIAGKGHEQGQELAGGAKIPFDDVEVARAALRRRIGAPTREAGRAIAHAAGGTAR